jgi:hypothetical protein
MGSKLLAGIAAGNIVLIGLGVATAQGPDCTGQVCTYLPAVQATGPTATPTTTWTPVPVSPDEDMCVSHGPAPGEGAQAWLLDYNLAPGDQAILCVRFTQSGQSVPSLLVRATARYPDRDHYLGSEVTRAGGVLALPFTVGQVPPGQLVVIDAEVQHSERLYGAVTQFLSQAVPTSTLVPTDTPTITPTATPTPTLTDTPVPPTPTPTPTPTI